jgi:hypothetical protein
VGCEACVVLDSPNLPQIFDVSFGLVNAAVGIIVLLLVLRLAAVLSLTWHKRTMWVFVAAAILMVASELAGAVGTLFRTSTLADIVEELAELVAIYSGDTALYLMS